MDAGCGTERYFYLYGVIPSGQAVPALVPDSFEVVRQGRVTALVEAVPAGDFSSDALEHNLASLEWVSRLARKHLSVLELAMQHGPVVPARLCTVYSTGDGVRTALEQSQDRLVGLLARLDGCEEWGLKLRRSPDAARRRIDAAGAAAASGAASAGAAWLAAKRCKALAAEAEESRLDALVEETVTVVSDRVLDSRQLPLPAAEDGATADPVILNLGMLVRQAGRPAFEAAVGALQERYRAEGVSVEVSGPWPAFNFCEEAT